MNVRERKAVPDRLKEAAADDIMPVKKRTKMICSGDPYEEMDCVTDDSGHDIRARMRGERLRPLWH